MKNRKFYFFENLDTFQKISFISPFFFMFLIILKNIFSFSFFLIIFYFILLILFLVFYNKFNNNIKIQNNFKRDFILINTFFFVFFAYNYFKFFLGIFFKNILDLIFLFYIIFFVIVFLFYLENKINFSFDLKLEYFLKTFYLICIFLFLFLFSFEKIPNQILIQNSFYEKIILAFIYSILIAIYEQLLFIGILYKSYLKNFKNISKNLIIIFISFLFSVIHISNFNEILNLYIVNSSIFLFLFYLVILYYFMKISILLYEKSKNIIYPILLHFLLDFILIILRIPLF